MTERTPEDTIRDASKVEQFLQDDVIRGAIAKLETSYIEKMIVAEDSTLRAKMQSKVQAIREFAGELKGLIENGVQELALAEVKAKRAEFEKKEGRKK